MFLVKYGYKGPSNMAEWEEGEGCVDIDECTAEFEATLTNYGYGDTFKLQWNVNIEVLSRKRNILHAWPYLVQSISENSSLLWEFLFTILLLGFFFWILTSCFSIGTTICRNNAHTCVNTQGSYYCTCDAGYVLWSKDYGCGEDKCAEG